MAIGEGDVTVTPLQLALAYAALGNGGTLYQPQVVRAVETSDGAVVQEFPPRIRRQVDVHAGEPARASTDALYDVVNDPNGTAYPARDPSLDVAGKTGTAQTGYVAKKDDDPKMAWYLSQNHAWFASFAPAHGARGRGRRARRARRLGPEVAVPVAMQIIHEYERLQAIRLGHAALRQVAPAARRRSRGPRP